MPWSEGSDNLSLAIDAAQAETDCGIDRERSGIVAHARRSESRAFDALALGYVDVTLLRDCSRIGPGKGVLKA